MKFLSKIIALCLLGVLATGLYASECNSFLDKANKDIASMTKETDADMIGAYASRANVYYTQYQICSDREDFEILKSNQKRILREINDIKNNKSSEGGFGTEDGFGTGY